MSSVACRHLLLGLATLGAAVLLPPGAAHAQLETDEPDSSMVQDVHPQDTAEDRGLRIVSRDRRVGLRILGSIRLVGLYDFNGVPGTNTFPPIDIPVGAENIATPRFEMGADQTRFGFEVDRRVDDRQDLFARLEMDFIPGGQVRLRHAFARGGRLLVGQTWTTIADVGALPLTVDLEGPNSSITIRNPQVRWMHQLESGAGIAFAAESPVTEVDSTDAISVENQFLPDLIGRFRRSLGQGHIQVGAIFRQFTYRAAGETLTYVPGGGFAVSGIVVFDETLALLYQGVYGVGISRYIGTFAERNLDLVPNEDGTELIALPAGGGYLALRMRWTETASTNLVVGTAAIDRSTYRPDDAYHNGQYIAINAFLEEISGLRLGLEYLWGRRENYDGETGVAHRIQFGTYFDF